MLSLLYSLHEKIVKATFHIEQVTYTQHKCRTIATFYYVVYHFLIMTEFYMYGNYNQNSKYVREYHCMHPRGHSLIVEISFSFLKSIKADIIYFTFSWAVRLNVTIKGDFLGLARHLVVTP